MPSKVDEKIASRGWEQANLWLRGAMQGETEAQASINLDVLRHACISVLAIDLTNASLQSGINRVEKKAHIKDISDLILELANDFEKRVIAGKTVREPLKKNKNDPKPGLH